MESNLVQQDNQRSGGPSIAFMRTLPGIMMLVNFIMLMICWCIMAVWKGNVIEPFASVLESETGYFLFVTVFPWLMYIVFFIILILGLDQQIGNINWPLAFFINCVLWAFLLFVAACVIAGKSNKSPCAFYLCDRLKAATAFGFLTSFGLGFQGYCHYREYKEKSGGNQYPTAGAV